MYQHLLSQSVPVAVLCSALSEAGTSACMWGIVFLPPIVAAQVAATVLIQNTKRDFI